MKLQLFFVFLFSLRETKGAPFEEFEVWSDLKKRILVDTYLRKRNFANCGQFQGSRYERHLEGLCRGSRPLVVDAKFNHYMVSLLSPLQVTRLEAVLAKMVDLEASQDPYMLQVRPVSSVLLIILNPGLNLLEGRKIWEDLKMDVGWQELPGGVILFWNSMVCLSVNSWSITSF